MPHQSTKPILHKRARIMRSNQTDAEAVLWNALRGRRLMGMKFKRQVPIGNYIVDFLCAEHKLIVEVDGSQHAERKYDQDRDTALQNRDFKVLRFWNNDVLKKLDSVCDAIIANADLGE